MTAITTAVYGGFDELRPQVAQNIECEWLVFTDDRGLHAPAPWRIVYAPATHDTPRMSAKVYKMHPQVAHADVIWIDANSQVTARSFAAEALHARHGGIAVWRHPRRDCIYAEAEASVGRESQGGKYDGEPIAEQAGHYRAEGHPEHFGLYACGVVAWDLRSKQATQLGAAWLAECEQWTSQDQISLPVVARRLGVTPGVFPVRQIERSRPGYLENRWHRLYNHLVAA